MSPGYFSSEFLQNLPADIDHAIIVLRKEFDRLEASGLTMQIPENSVEVLAIVSAFMESRGVPLNGAPRLGPDHSNNTGLITSYIRRLGAEAQSRINERDANNYLAEKSGHYAAVFGSVSYYEFEENDFNRIQVLTNEIRDLIRGSLTLSQEHRGRLLRRLEAMQAELHKKCTDIDRFWGFIGEAGIVIKKFGADVEPLTARISELGRIVIAVVMAKEGIQALPGIVELLKLK